MELSDIRPERSISLFGEIDSESIREFTPQFVELCQSAEPIFLWIDSEGGGIVDSLFLVDLIRSSNSFVWGIGMGSVHSSSVLVLSCCSRRLCFSHTQFLMHPTSAIGMEDSGLKEGVMLLNEFNKQEVQFDSALSAMTNMTVDEVGKYSNFENYFYGDQAIKYGIVDDFLGG